MTGSLLWYGICIFRDPVNHSFLFLFFISIPFRSAIQLIYLFILLFYCTEHDEQIPPTFPSLAIPVFKRASFAPMKDPTLLPSFKK